MCGVRDKKESRPQIKEGWREGLHPSGREEKSTDMGSAKARNQDTMDCEHEKTSHKKVQGPDHSETKTAWGRRPLQMCQSEVALDPRTETVAPSGDKRFWIKDLRGGRHF